MKKYRKNYSSNVTTHVMYNIVQQALADITTHIIRLLASTKNMVLTYRKKTV